MQSAQHNKQSNQQSSPVRNKQQQRPLQTSGRELTHPPGATFDSQANNNSPSRTNLFPNINNNSNSLNMHNNNIINSNNHHGSPQRTTHSQSPKKAITIKPQSPKNSRVAYPPTSPKRIGAPGSSNLTFNQGSGNNQPAVNYWNRNSSSPKNNTPHQLQKGSVQQTNNRPQHRNPSPKKQTYRNTSQVQPHTNNNRNIRLSFRTATKSK
eukprot:UN30440